jgi:hypothetical protein
MSQQDPYGILAASAFQMEQMLKSMSTLTVSATSTQEKTSESPKKSGECPHCRIPLIRDVNNIQYNCGECGLIVDGDPSEPYTDEATDPVKQSTQLRIVGRGSGQYQSDLYRSGSVANTAMTQQKQIYNEYVKYRKTFIESGGNAIQLDACKLAAVYYNDIQRNNIVRRSENKKKIMAACLYWAAIHLGFAPSRVEIATLMQLSSKGIASGENFVRSLVSQGIMDVDVNANPCRPEITTIFAHMGFEHKDYNDLREAVYDVVQLSIENNIGTNSVLRSKVAGATYVILKRCTDKELVPKHIHILAFCEKCKIRKNTAERFTKQLAEYHSFFVQIYTKYGLNIDR